MAIVNKFNVNKQQVTLDPDIIENMSANDVSYDDSTQYNENTVGDKLNKLSELEQQVIYDITENNNGVTFDSLSALLSDESLSILIPTSVRHGGMSIRFVQSSDNKYIQARCMAQNFTTDVTQWQGVDDKPTVGSPNLVTSGGIQEKLNQIDGKLIIDNTTSDLSFADSNYNEIVQFKNGGIKTKNFDSTKTISASKETGADIDICDENNNIVLRVSKGHIKTKYFDSTVVNSEPSSIREIIEDTFLGSRFKYDEVGVLDYYAAYDELCDYRHIVEKETPIGYSTLPSDDRLSKDPNQYPINLYRIPNANATKRIVLMGSIHGDSQYTEVNPTGNGWYGDSGDAQEAILTPYFFVVDLIRHKDDNPQYKKLLETYEIDIIPIINPWGVQNHSRRNGNNVDLNRNFDVTDSNGESRWENVEGSSGAYKGANPFSENESQAIRDYINSHNDIHLVIETHARGNVNLEGDFRFFAVYPDDNSARDLESAIINAVNSSKKHFGSGGGQRGYTRDNTNPSCYSWIFYEKGILAFEPELAQNMANRFYSIITLSEDRRLNVNDVYIDSFPQTSGYAHTIRVVSSDGSNKVLVETETYYTINNGVFTCGSDSITISSHSVLDSKARHSKDLQYSQVWYYKRLLFNIL